MLSPAHAEETDRGAAAARLVLSLCHEVGNLVGAVRLQAHLLDDDLNSVGIAAASIEIDDLAARTSALLALVRPLLAPPVDDDGLGALPQTVMVGVEAALVAHGGRGVEILVDVPDSLPPVTGQPELLHQLLVTLAFCALEETRPRGHVRLTAESLQGGGALFTVEDDGAEDPDLPDWPNQPPRGRTLACAIAAHVAEGLGGRLEVRRVEGRTRVELMMPPELPTD